MLATDETYGRISCAACEITPALKERWQCEPAGKPVFKLYRGTAIEFDIDRCPMHFIDPTVSDTLWLYSQYILGNLPESGGVLDQSASLMRAFRVIAEAVALLRPKE